MKKIYAIAALAASICLPAAAQEINTLYVAGAQGQIVNFEQLGNWDIVHPVEVPLKDGKFTIECEGLTAIGVSTKKAMTTEQDGWDIWSENRIGPSQTLTASNLGLPIPVKGPGKGELKGPDILTPWTGDYVIEITADLKTMTVTTTTPEPEITYYLYFDGNWNNFAVEKWAFEKELGTDNVYWLDCTDENKIGPTSNINIMRDSNWNNWWTSPVRPINLQGQTMSWVYKLTQNPEGQSIPAGTSYTGTIKIVVPQEIGAGSKLEVTFYPDFMDHDSSSVKEIELDDSSESEYFNLQGARVNSVQPGSLYIKKNGSKVSKIIVK